MLFLHERHALDLLRHAFNPLVNPLRHALDPLRHAFNLLVNPLTHAFKPIRLHPLKASLRVTASLPFKTCLQTLRLQRFKACLPFKASAFKVMPSIH